MKTVETLLLVAGLLQIGLLLAGATMPRAVQLKKHLSALPPFIRQLVWVYYSFIGFVLLSFGVLTLLHARALVAGDPFARAFCAFVAMFWIMRLFAAIFVFDVRGYITNNFLRVGYWLTNVVFIYLPVVYGWAALGGAR